MNLTITQSNLNLLLPAKVSGVGRIYAEEHNCSILEGQKRFYASKIHSMLEREESKLWHLGAVDLYQMWEQKEIRPSSLTKSGKE